MLAVSVKTRRFVGWRKADPPSLLHALIHERSKIKDCARKTKASPCRLILIDFLCCISLCSEAQIGGALQALASSE